MSKQDNLSAKAKAMLADVAPAPAPAPSTGPRLGPTPEQMKGGRFERESSKTAHGQVNAVAYRRQPLFETLAKGKSAIDLEGLAALRFYRNRYEETAQSLTRCALDIEARGGGLPLCLPPGLYSDDAVRRCDAAMGAVADTVRAVALEDTSFSDVAIARFGSRKQSWIETEKHRGRTKKGGKMAFVEKIVPISGRHREIIRDEFLLGLKRLTAAVRQMTTTTPPPAVIGVDLARAPDQTGVAIVEGGEAPKVVTSIVDAEFLDERGMMKPAAEIADILRSRAA